MELNIRDFTSDNETYYMLRTKNYKKNKMKYPKNNGLLDFYKLYYICSNENYDKNLQDLIEKNIMKDDKLFIVTFRFNDDNIVMIYRGVKTANNNFLDKYIDADEKYQKTRFKILPIIKSNSKFLNFLSKDNKPIMMAKKTETKFINNDNYF